MGQSRRLQLVLAIVAGLLLIGAGAEVDDVLGQHLRPGEARRPSALPRVAVTETPPPARKPVVPAVVGSSGKFAYAPGSGAVLGGRGPIRRFRVAVELPVAPAAVAAFVDEVDRVLGDGRGWIAERRFRFQRVSHSAPAEFVVHLASARTSQLMCRRGGLETGGFTSCRLPHLVIINASRWQRAVPGYGAPLATYRAYAINHEVGHQLGHGHVPCPGKGRPAPVMMQQTYGLRGCTANAWPYPGEAG